MNNKTDIPAPPFIGHKIINYADFDEVAKRINTGALFGSRWGYEGAGGHHPIKRIKDQAEADLARLLEQVKKKRLFTPLISYGFYYCNSEDGKLNLYDENDSRITTFDFPRQADKKKLCLADYFLPESAEKRDVISLQLVTIGKAPIDFAEKLKTDGKLTDYFLYHGLFAELAEALAEYRHHLTRKELGFDESPIPFAASRGKRYSFGYPSCPNMEGNSIISEILEAKRLGITMTESHQMVPEYSTSAVIVHNPKAVYFNV